MDNVESEKSNRFNKIIIFICTATVLLLSTLLAICFILHIRFFFCYKGHNYDYDCPENLSFSQEICQCIKLKSTTPQFTETTTQIVTCPSDCPYVDDPSDDCSKYYSCYNGMNIPYECPGSLCFNQDECSCLPTETSSTKPQSITTEQPSTTTKQRLTTAELPSTTTTTATTKTTTKQPSTTTKPPSTITEPSTTTTKSSIFTTTENSATTVIDYSSTTTELTCSLDCPYVDDPTDECSKYYHCTEIGNIQKECPASFCFDESACQCMPYEGTTGPYVTTAVSITCSDECPYADDPTDDCSKYYYCSSEGNIEQECPLSFCFDQSACQCRPSGETTETYQTTAVSITCSDECPYADDPTDDCSKYFLCDGNGGLIPYDCPGTLCFNQDVCQCR
ncbi:UNVERIFIED_CONTAM: hypothetical protein RMT77_003067 [Armadillidium vulgare]